MHQQNENAGSSVSDWKEARRVYPRSIRQRKLHAPMTAPYYFRVENTRQHDAHPLESPEAMSGHFGAFVRSPDWKDSVPSGIE